MARSTAQPKPPKKSRIVSSSDSTTLSRASNAQRLTQVRAVVLRTTTHTNRRRLGQQSTHTEMEIDADDSDDEASEPGDDPPNDTGPRQEDIGFDGDSDSEDDGEEPKRPPVRAPL